MSQARIWTGTASFTSGSSTPFGIYDSDASFQTDAPKVASWCAKRLGYPIIDVELEGDNFFAVFEEAISSKMGKDRVQDHLDSDVEVLTGADHSCLMHLEGIVNRNKQPLKVMHIAEILNSSL